jgi:hypothetical protein
MNSLAVMLALNGLQESIAPCHAALAKVWLGGAEESSLPFRGPRLTIASRKACAAISERVMFFMF